VKFWNKDNWTEFCKINKQAEVADLPEPLRGNTQASQGINVVMRYLEDQHGNVVDGFSAAMMRSLAWAIWVELGISGAALLTWGQADAETRKDITGQWLWAFSSLDFVTQTGRWNRLPLSTTLDGF